MSELKPCPFCGSTDIIFRGAFNENLQCEACGAEMYGWSTKQEAITAWNRRAQPDNAPITLDELRGMDGEPVWVVYDDDSAQWALVDAGNVADELKLTGHWGEQIVLAEHKAHIKAIYRRRPEPEGGEG